MAERQWKMNFPTPSPVPERSCILEAKARLGLLLYWWWWWGRGTFRQVFDKSDKTVSWNVWALRLRASNLPSRGLSKKWSIMASFIQTTLNVGTMDKRSPFNPTNTHSSPKTLDLATVYEALPSFFAQGRFPITLFYLIHFSIPENVIQKLISSNPFRNRITYGNLDHCPLSWSLSFFLQQTYF